MDPLEEKKFVSSYVPLDLASSVAEWSEGIQVGESCRIDALKDTFAWMRGFVNGFYGWSNDGKGTMLDFLKVIKSKVREEIVNGKPKKVDGWKFGIYKQEDMDSVIVNGHPKIRANRIYKNLAWTLTGKTWSKNFAAKYHSPRMTLDEEMNALEFIQEHFFVIYPEDRRYKNVLDDFMFLHEKFGIDSWEIDPWNVIKLTNEERGDERLVNAFIDIKEFTMQTNSVFNIVNHPRSMMDVKEKNGAYKVVNQFMQLGGSAWDMKMDGQYSIYRPERHRNPSDPKVHFYNLKQRQAEIVGVTRGHYEKIKFDFKRKQYYFDGINPMDGSYQDIGTVKSADLFTPKKEPVSAGPSDFCPF